MIDASSKSVRALTFEQRDMKSFRQADRSAFSCALVGRGAWALTAVVATCGEAVVTSDTMTRMRDDMTGGLCGI
jgi:hypothetical protein